MKNILIYSCVLLFLSCNRKPRETSQSSSVEQETQENTSDEYSPVISEPFSIEIYNEGDWLMPNTLSESLLKEPEASALKEYIPDSICRKQIHGVECCFYKGTLMHGAYKDLYFRATDSFVSEPYYSVTVYKAGVKNDTVRHYSISSHRMTNHNITLDSIHEIYQSYYDNGHPYIFYQAKRGKLDGVRQRWSYDGKPDWFEHYKEGKLHGEERRWYTNGYLWQVNHYIDDRQVFPSEEWYYTRATDHYSGSTDEAPDCYEYKYQASEDTPPYYIEETYALENGEKKYLLKRKYFERGSDNLIYLMDDKCDSVQRNLVTIGSQRRLEIRNYSDGQLRCFESYPYSEGGVPGVMAKSYSQEGNLIKKSMYDYLKEEMVTLRTYHNTGADVKKIEFNEYTDAKTKNCNRELDPGKGRYTDSREKLSVHWKNGKLALLNSSSSEDEDGFKKWYYDGYHPDYGLHFFHFSGYENWGYFAMSDTTGEVYEFHSADIPVFCGKSGLFLVVDEDSYEGVCNVRIYQMLPEGRLAEVAILDRGCYHTEVDLDGFTWIGPSSFIANKKTLKDGVQYDFYKGRMDSYLEEYIKKLGYLQDSDNESGYVQVNLRPDALQAKQQLSSSLDAINEMNACMGSFIEEH